MRRANDKVGRVINQIANVDAVNAIKYEVRVSQKSMLNDSGKWQAKIAIKCIHQMATPSTNPLVTKITL
jgi:hypothetical protein